MASISSGHPSPGRRVPSTVETRWNNPGWGSVARSSGTWTDPNSHTRPKSLRTRSTIITFSAWSLSKNPSAVAAVPLMGDERTTAPWRLKKRSGEADATAMFSVGNRTTALYGAGLPSASAAPNAATSAPAGTGADSRRVRFTW